MTLTRSLALAMFALGCTQTRECDNVVQTVNTAVADVRALAPPDAEATAPASLEEAAKRYDRLAADLEALNVRSTKLQRHVGEYVLAARRTATAIRKLIEAHEKEDQVKLVNQKRELERIVSQERLLVLRIDNVCQP